MPGGSPKEITWECWGADCPVRAVFPAHYTRKLMISYLKAHGWVLRPGHVLCPFHKELP